MSRAPSAAAMAGPRAAPTADLTARVRDKIREMRDLEKRKSDLEEQLKSVNVEIHKMRSETLPGMFSEAGITILGIEAEGNLPAYTAEKGPHYHANISAEWEPERRAAAYRYLEGPARAPELVKTEITVLVDRKDRKFAKKVVAALKKMGAHPQEDLSVPWNTLTAWLRRQVESNKTPNLELIGATVGEVVKLKPIDKTGDI